MLHVYRLSQWYAQSKNVIDKVDFSISPQTSIGLLGANGAGKTTLINFLSGVHRHYTVERVEWEGQPIRINCDEFKRKRYTVYSDDLAFGHWTFDEYIQFIHKAYHKHVNQYAVARLVWGFGFEPYRKQPMNLLSTGNRKKVFLISGFALQLPLLILDEPASGLDHQSIEFLKELIAEYRSFGTVLMSGQSATSFGDECTCVFLLQEGKLQKKTVSKGADLELELAGCINE